MVWLTLVLMLQIAPRMLEVKTCGIMPRAREDLELLWHAWRGNAEAAPAACLLGHVEGGAVIEMVLPTADLETCRHERVLGGLKFERAGLLSEQHFKEQGCVLLDGRVDWYIAVIMRGTADDDLFICARLSEGTEEHERIGS